MNHDTISVGDCVVVSNPHRPRFAVKVEKVQQLSDGRPYFVGRVFSIGTFERKGLIAFSGNRRKVVTLRPTTTVERIEVGR